MTHVLDDAQKLERICSLNDQLRTTCVGGAIVCTNGVAALPAATRRQIMNALRGFTDFNPDNDPHGEHDFGAFEIDGERLFFKIDYYDRKAEFHSPDPADPAVTTRILTLMLAEEY